MKLFKILIFIFTSLAISIKAYSNEKLEILLQEGGKLLIIRHAYAPGTGDPENFNVNDCTTQRNLNEKGIVESKKLGTFFF